MPVVRVIHATRTMAGFMGGLRDTEVPPTVPVTATAPARAVVEGVAVDKTDANRACPKYTQLLVTAPDTTTAATVPVDIDTCQLQVHPVGSAAADSSYHEHTETAEYTIDITYPTGLSGHEVGVGLRERRPRLFPGLGRPVRP